MSALVPIPWQPHLYLTPHTLAYLVRASENYGAELHLYDAEYKRISPAWRPTAQQLTAWLRGKAGLGPTASSPYTGQRNHMRGAAMDLVLTTARAQKACRDAGLIRDTGETWHWNDPTWRTMPIIKTMTKLPAPTIRAKDPDMPAIIINTQSSRLAPTAKFGGDVYVIDSNRLARKVGATDREQSYMPVVRVAGDAQLIGQLNTFGWSAADAIALHNAKANNAYIIREGATKSGVLVP